MSEVYIPKRIKVGYQERDDTYTKRLAYVICYDIKGKLRKEQSWESWRDNKIEAEEYDNTPQDGFVLNKNIERFGWSHYGSGRSYIRVYDPRGIEFEITPENLIGILMHTNCSKRQLEDKFVYAWSGKDLVLLPVQSEEYQNAMKFTERLEQKVSAKSLVPGCSYTTKREGKEVIYLGRFLWYHWNMPYYWNNQEKRATREGTKQHIFMEGDNIFPKDNTSFLAYCNNPAPVADYAERLEKFKADRHSAAVVDYIVKPAQLQFKETGNWNNNALERSTFHRIDKDSVTEYIIQSRQEFDRVQNKYVGEHRFSLNHSLTFDTKTGKLTGRVSSSGLDYYYHEGRLQRDTEFQRMITKEALITKFTELGLGTLYIKLENGKKFKADTINSLGDK
jgi:hypothetical protein